MNLPIYDPKTKTGEKGVRLVADAVEDNLGWIFRTKRKTDVGIDGEIEIVTNENMTTGRLVSVQIKCGNSFFEEETQTGFVFRGDLIHLKYWLDHSLPVIVILCNPTSNCCYWGEVTPGNIEVFSKGWKINILRSNKLEKASCWAIESIAKNSLYKELLELSLYRWLHEKYYKRIAIADIIGLPRDFHWHTFLAEIDDETVSIDFVYARYGVFEPTQLTDSISHLDTNKVFGLSKLILFLISQNPLAFKFSKTMQDIIDSNHNVEFVRLLTHKDSTFFQEVTENDELIDGYTRGEEMDFGGSLWDDIL